jgi:outer membrane protein
MPFLGSGNICTDQWAARNGRGDVTTQKEEKPLLAILVRFNPLDFTKGKGYKRMLSLLKGLNMLRTNWLFVVAIGFLSLPALGQVKIGVVDMQRALVSVNEGKKAKEKLEREARQKQAELDKKQTEIKKLQGELEQQAAVLSDEKKRQKAAQYQQMLMDLQDFYLNNQKALADMESELMKPIMERFGRILQEIGAKEGYTIIIEKSALLFNSAITDLTDRLIQEFNAGKGK